MKRPRIAYRPAWTHHPRGGKITGFAGPIRPGLYGPERGLATTEAAARAGEFFTHAPASQVYLATETNCPHKCNGRGFIETPARAGKITLPAPCPFHHLHHATPTP